jgi:hypothetical protein|tara:strand:+ start:312 stop:1196 length:885 start_codon:yes stop_codon:yes gene_type:complete
MNFTPELLIHFKAEAGAFSEVTLREATGDKSVTLDRYEKSVLNSRYLSDTFTRGGGASPDELSIHHNFIVWNYSRGPFDAHTLAVKYPKASGNELRLYFNRESHFYPSSNSIWFIFIRTGEPTPYIGYMDINEWEFLINGANETAAYEADYALDDQDELYQKVIHSPQVQSGQSQQIVTRHNRNANIAAEAIHYAGYTCQYDPSHRSFLSAASGKPYVEVHHLIPISQSNNANVSLDVPANLIVLCPNCHRAIHYGIPDVKRSYLSGFYYNRIQNLNDSGLNITLDQLYHMYGV